MEVVFDGRNNFRLRILGYKFYEFTNLRILRFHHKFVNS